MMETKTTMKKKKRKGKLSRVKQRERERADGGDGGGRLAGQRDKQREKVPSDYRETNEAKKNNYSDTEARTCLLTDGEKTRESSPIEQ
jgi:hypothetical protein